MTSKQDGVTVDSTTDGAEPPDVGGVEERRNVQRTFGELRQLDEHQPP